MFNAVRKIFEGFVLEEDKELEKIKRIKLEKIIRKAESGLAPDKANKPIVVNGSNFEEVIKRKDLVAIDFWASWCAPCRMMAPIIDELAKDYVGKITFGKLNVDDNQEMALKYQIMSIPTILVFKNGKIVDRIVGAMPKKLLEQRLVKHL
jgi:thioredoxin 1